MENRHRSKNLISLVIILLLLPVASTAQQRGDIPSGTTLIVRLANRLDSDTNRSGQRFDAILDENVVVGGRVLAPAGSNVTGTLTEVRDAGRVSGRARMSLTLTDMRIGGTTYPIETNTLTVEADNSRSKDVGLIGGGALLGAIVGAIAGGGKGAAIGAATGAAAGTGAVLVTEGRDVEFEPEQKFQFVLDRTLRVDGVAVSSIGRRSVYDRSIDRSIDDDQIGRTSTRRETVEALNERAQALWTLVSDRRSGFARRGTQGTELYTLVRDFATSADRLAQPGRSYGPRSGTQDEVRMLLRQAERISSLMDSMNVSSRMRSEWEGVEEQVSRLGEVYAMTYSPNRSLARTDPYSRDPYYSRTDPYYATTHGTFRWRGRVDGSDYVSLRSNQVVIRHVSAQSITDSSFDLTEPLPRQPMTVSLTRISGRGRVEVVQQPSASNNYTVTVLIEDPRAGTDWYEFELSW